MLWPLSVLPDAKDEEDENNHQVSIPENKTAKKNQGNLAKYQMCSPIELDMKL